MQHLILFWDTEKIIIITSPAVKQIFLNPKSQSAVGVTENTNRFNEDLQPVYYFNHYPPLNGIKEEDLDLIFLLWGYGTMWDLKILI